jgi:hypothetical protein
LSDQLGKRKPMRVTTEGSTLLVQNVAQLTFGGGVALLLALVTAGAAKGLVFASAVDLIVAPFLQSLA